MSKTINYVVDLDERGEFRATLYDGDTEIGSIDTEDAQWLIENYGVRHMRDLRGLKEYYVALGVMDAEDSLVISG